MSFEEKYLKYKNKYLNLKNQTGGMRVTNDKIKAKETELEEAKTENDMFKQKELDIEILGIQARTERNRRIDALQEELESLIGENRAFVDKIRAALSPAEKRKRRRNIIRIEKNSS